MKNQELARHFFRLIEKIAEKKEATDAEKIAELYQLLHTVFFEVTQQEKIQFTTFFARVAFACQKFNLPQQKQFFVHTFRKKALQPPLNIENTHLVFQLGIRAVADAVKFFYEVEMPPEIERILPPLSTFNVFRPADITARRPMMRVVIHTDDAAAEMFEATDEDTAERIKIKYNITERNENYNRSVNALRNVFSFPTTVHLLDVEVDTEGVHRPRAFVIEPDFLLDVTAVAECFGAEGNEPLLYLLKKFLPHELSDKMMIGNIANFFLDEIIANPEVDYNETIRKTFKINALAFCVYEDLVVKEIFKSSQKHFTNIRKVVLADFPKNGIERTEAYIEPSFYSPKYGLQGRLDLFYKSRKAPKMAIVELKSGTAYKPNIYGISNNHFTQTLLYDLLIESTFGKSIENTNYILYSVLETDNLKYAPPLRAQQYEALNTRNLILAFEQMLINLNKEKFVENNIFKILISKLLDKIGGFDKRNIELFAKVYTDLNDLERRYFAAFSSFIAREHQLAKIGVEDVEGVNGQSNLWLGAHKDKEQNFEILSFLKIKENKSFENDPFLLFEKTEQTNRLANFRQGDVVVLYPNTEGGAKIAANQIFKCTITRLERDVIELRLRSRQLNQELFELDNFWFVERDMMDSSFVGMYRSLFNFAQAPQPTRNLLLTLAPPRVQEGDISNFNFEGKEKMTLEQQKILKKILLSKDYFLLWGPPGTGKTSVMLRYLVSYLRENTTENILLLAYTNRAVDEICESIEQIGGSIKADYVRIGSRFSTEPRFHNQLLEQKIEAQNIATRAALRDLVINHRIFVGTVAAITGKPEIFKLKKFNRVVIDEASQILEPLLIGMLPHFEHFTLIGDHKQLPAIVQQSENESHTNEKLLHSIGLRNLRHSYFERLFKRAEREKWTWAYDILSHQGRMHNDIMHFPSSEFYENQLQILPDEIGDFQQKHLYFEVKNKDILAGNIIEKISTQRVVFVNTEADKTAKLSKTNRFEAEYIKNLIQLFAEVYQDTPLSIGVITPYRAQIAQIRKTMEDNNLDPEKYTIDTVERYQGGARDIILISLCTNDTSQLSSLISLSEEGVDRKLNVALTRARQHLVVVGNADILRGGEIYRRFVEKYG